MNDNEHADKARLAKCEKLFLALKELLPEAKAFDVEKLREWPQPARNTLADKAGLKKTSYPSDRTWAMLCTIIEMRQRPAGDPFAGLPQ